MKTALFPLFFLSMFVIIKCFYRTFFFRFELVVFITIFIIIDWLFGTFFFRFLRFISWLWLLVLFCFSNMNARHWYTKTAFLFFFCLTFFIITSWFDRTFFFCLFRFFNRFLFLRLFRFSKVDAWHSYVKSTLPFAFLFSVIHTDFLTFGLVCFNFRFIFWNFVFFCSVVR